MNRVVLQIVQHMKPGGIETMALDLQHHMKDFDVHIVSLEGKKEDVLENWPRLKQVESRLHCLDKKPGLQISTVLKLVLLIKRLKAKAVHSHHIGPLTYGGVAARFCGLKELVHTEHDAWHLEDPRAATLEQKLIRYLRPTLVADCHTVSKNLKAIIQEAEPVVIYNGIDTRKFSPATKSEKLKTRQFFKMDEQAFFIGCAARMEKVKGLHYLISAMPSLPDYIKLVLAGDGSEKQALNEIVIQLGLRDRVQFLGRIERMDLFYKSLDMFCLPSLNEGFPLSPLEAQACDIPTIITDVGGAKEALCATTGQLIPAKDTDAINQAIKTLAGREFQKDTEMVTPRDFVMKHADMHLMIGAYSNLLKG
ncbi:glycosyltransferase [Curvivirga sp.]|uniref:glycosyltransferase n=1 Tax=Curvivirga sp. TaxID=2856848 RepID=UPI003B5B31D8